MDLESNPEPDITPAFQIIGQLTDEVSKADFETWRRARKLKKMTKKRWAPKTQKHLLWKLICTHHMHEDDMTALMAPKKARMAKATMNDLQSLHGPQQVITGVPHKRQVSTQECLVRWTPTFMLKPHI